MQLEKFSSAFLVQSEFIFYHPLFVDFFGFQHETFLLVLSQMESADSNWIRRKKIRNNFFVLFSALLVKRLRPDMTTIISISISLRFHKQYRKIKLQMRTQNQVHIRWYRARKWKDESLRNYSTKEMRRNPTMYQPESSSRRLFFFSLSDILPHNVREQKKTFEPRLNTQRQPANENVFPPRSEFIFTHFSPRACISFVFCAFSHWKLPESVSRPLFVSFTSSGLIQRVLIFSNVRLAKWLEMFFRFSQPRKNWKIQRNLIFCSLNLCNFVMRGENNDFL